MNEPINSKKKKPIVLAIVGSTRRTSTNLSLVQAIAQLSNEYFSVTIFQGISDLPHFNPDLDTDTPPGEIRMFRELLRNSDGVLISTPEYAMGVPGTLKNALDWTVSSSEFSKKPVALITASSLGEKGHASLLDTLRVIESDITDETHLLISFVRTKVNALGEITYEATRKQVINLVKALSEKLTKPA